MNDALVQDILVGDIKKEGTLWELLNQVGLVPDSLEKGSKDWKCMILLVASFRLGHDEGLMAALEVANGMANDYEAYGNVDDSGICTNIAFNILKLKKHQ